MRFLSVGIARSSAPVDGGGTISVAARALHRLLQRLIDRVVAAHVTADLRSLAAGRIVMSLVLLFDLGMRASQLGLWYTNAGLIPNHTLLWRPPWDHVFSLFYLASYPYEAIAGYTICAIAYLALLVGFRTPVARIASLVCLLSLHGRMLLFDNGGDVALGLLCIWTTFLPTGARWSVDALLAQQRHEHGSADSREARTPSAGGRTAVSLAVSLAVLALTWQLAFIYFFNAVHKEGATWREGSAVHYVLHLDRLATPLAVWLREWMPPNLSRALTWTALAIEWSLPALLLSPFGVRYCRRVAIVLIVALHGGFALFMNLGSFVLAMIAFTPNFLHGDDWDALARWWARGRGGQRGQRWIDLVDRLRQRVSSSILRVAAALTPGRSIRLTAPGPVAQALLRRLPLAREMTVVALIVIATSQLLDENAAAHRLVEHRNASPVAAAVSYLNLFQGWSMFAPDAPTTDFNIVVDATTADGRHVDPFSEVATPHHPAPGLQIPSGRGPSWLFYGYENHLPNRPAYHHALEEWILRYPERTGRANDRIVAFKVYSVEDDSPPLGERTPRNLRSSVLIKYP